MKLVRLYRNMFLLALLDRPCTTFYSIPIISTLLTNRSIDLIYSVTIFELKTKDCARLVSFYHKLQHRCFQLWCLPAFITSLRRRSTPVSSVLRKSVRFFITNIFLIKTFQVEILKMVWTIASNFQALEIIINNHWMRFLWYPE